VNGQQRVFEALDSGGLEIGYEAYMDYHYSADFNNAKDNFRPFNSNPINVNQFALAYTYAQATFEYRRMTAKAAFHTGEIVSLMYAGEDYLTKFIRELSFTYRMTYKMEIEAGIFPAIYGAETFINMDNLHATRAVMTDFAPDFETGIRMKYRFNKYWRTTLQVTNGWQTIKENNHSPGFGAVLIYDKPRKFLFNYGVFLGNEVYQSKNALDQLKFYNNLFARIYVGKKWIFAPMIDYGMIRNPATQVMDTWHAYGGSVRYALTPEWGVAARYERVYDPNQIINEVITNTPSGFQIHGSTLTLEYVPAPQVMVRLEGRHSLAKDPVYNYGDNQKSRQDFFVMLAIAIQLKNSTAVKMKTEPGLKDNY
jgi:hypothetical protein